MTIATATLSPIQTLVESFYEVYGRVEKRVSPVTGKEFDLMITDKMTLENFMTHFAVSHLAVSHKVTEHDCISEYILMDENDNTIASDESEIDELDELMNDFILETNHPVFSILNYSNAHCNWDVYLKDGKLTGKAQGEKWVEETVE